MKRAFIGVYFLVCIMGCSSITGVVTGTPSFEKSAYQTLAVAATLYNAATFGAVDAKAKGLITDAQLQKIRDAAVVYYMAYQTAVSALEFYKMSRTDMNKSEASTALGRLSSAQSQLELATQGVPK